MDSKPNATKSDAEHASQLRTQLIRSCERYEDEYEQCKSSKSRRQQMFVDGKYADCEPWAQDMANCAKWVWNGDEEAARAIIDHETQRLDQRLIPHLHNQVWKKRDGPPADWNKPLPEFEEVTKNTYLTYIKIHGEDSMDLTKQCVIQ